MLALVVVIIGLGGIIFPVLPGLALQVAAIFLWALAESSVTGWVVTGLATATAVAATILKYTHPGRRLKEAGIPRWVITLAVVVGVIGFFAIPVFGAPVGFGLTIYLFARNRGEPGWESTKAAVDAVARSIGIELTGGLVILFVFMTGVLLS